MTNTIKKTTCIICALVMLLCCTYNVNADSSMTGLACNGSMNIVGDGNLLLSACATTNIPVDKLKIIMYLEKYDPASQTWKVIKSYTFTGYNTNILCKSVIENGTAHGTYRLRVIVYAELNGNIEQTYFITNPITV